MTASASESDTPSKPEHSYRHRLGKVLGKVE